MGVSYQENSLTWQSDSSQWKLYMEVSSSQKGVSAFPFLVERFISEEDLLNPVDGSVKSEVDIESEITNSGKYLFRRVATLKDLLAYPTEQELAAELRAKQLGRMEVSATHDGSSPGLQVGDSIHTYSDFTYPSEASADEHYDHIPVAGYYKYRVDTMSALYSTYDLAVAIQEANDTYLRVYAGDFLEDTAAEFLPLSVGIAGVYPSRTFTPGSLQASDLVAGDSIYLSVSGGSGDYSATINKDGLLEEISETKRYRVVSNTTEDVTITVRDEKTSESKTVELTIVQKGS